MKERMKTTRENKIETTNRKKRTNIHKIMKDTNKQKTIAARKRENRNNPQKERKKERHKERKKETLKLDILQSKATPPLLGRGIGFTTCCVRGASKERAPYT